MIERQELYCHNCGKYVQFDLDLSINGNHVLLCPNCGHEHCRVVKDGVITGDRWDSRNNNTYYISSNLTAYTTTSTYSTSNTTSTFLYVSWMNATATT
jgi:DNA-directed RNA polymerase subunit RPC12/RpoP